MSLPRPHGVTPIPRDRHLLVRVQGGPVGEVTPLSGTSLRVGRAPDSNLLLADTGVSRQHARLVWKQEAYWIEDLGSANGTYANGESVTGVRRLTDGDTLQFGPLAVFRYTLTDAEQEAMLVQLYQASVTDSLTGVYNREYFDRRLLSELAFARRHGTELGLLMLDLDHFKQINDGFGHPAGDTVLVEFAAAITANLRTEDIFARFGGEEFAIILRDTSVDNAYRVAERFRMVVESLRVEIAGACIKVTVSIGVASLSGLATQSGEALIAAADRRLYGAKQAGRNRVVASD